MKSPINSNKYRTVLCLIIFVFIVSLSGCKTTTNKSTTDSQVDDKNTFPVTITDDLGRKIKLPVEPQRIVSLAPGNTEILFYLGLGDRVVGVTDYCKYPKEARLCPKIGGFSDPSLEKVVALKPDLVLATGMHQQMLPQLENAGLKVLVLNPHKIEGIFNDIKMVGRAAGIESKANALAQGLSDRVNAVSQKVAKIPEKQRPKVYYELWNEPLMSVGRDAIIGQIIEVAGGQSITDDCTEPYPQISEEVIIARNPDVMVDSYGHGDAEAPTPAEIAARKGWENTEFVKTNRIYSINTDLLSIPGPRIVEGLEKMAECLHPEIFN